MSDNNSERELTITKIAEAAGQTVAEAEGNIYLLGETFNLTEAEVIESLRPLAEAKQRQS